MDFIFYLVYVVSLLCLYFFVWTRRHDEITAGTAGIMLFCALVPICGFFLICLVYFVECGDEVLYWKKRK